VRVESPDRTPGVEIRRQLSHPAHDLPLVSRSRSGRASST
jgi:hypothetical protein